MLGVGLGVFGDTRRMFGVCVGRRVGVRSCVQLGIAGIVFADVLAGSWLGCFVLVFPHTAIRHAIKATICGSYAI